MRYDELYRITREKLYRMTTQKNRYKKECEYLRKRNKFLEEIIEANFRGRYERENSKQYS